MTNKDSNIVIYSTTWCSDCKRAKKFFGEQRIPYTNIDIEENPEFVAVVEKINEGKRCVPTIVFPDGTILVEPSNAELADKLGLQTVAKRSFYDVIIIGGGPTGLTSAIYLAREGFETLVIERGALGGQAGMTQSMENFPGFDLGISGSEFADRLSNQARRFGVEILQATDVNQIEKEESGYLCVTTINKKSYGSKAVLIATGALSANFFASSRPVCRSLSAGTTSFTRPILMASSARRIFPVKISSFALAAPINFGALTVPPAPGMIPRSISGNPIRALSAAIRKSQVSASSSPPPSA